jgi:hypothetical protein
MDWYAWLSRTGLAPSLTYVYERLFSRNELEPRDAAHFDHDLLEILKLAKKQAAAAGDDGAEAAGAGAASTASWLVRRAKVPVPLHAPAGRRRRRRREETEGRVVDHRRPEDLQWR